jgi:putative polyketide hydroxylase
MKLNLGERMRSESTNHAPVLIAGAGPAGLTAAITLARQGVECLLVERRQELSAHPRATGVSTRTMELLRSFGLEAAIRAGGAEVEWQELVCETLARAADGVALSIGVPTRQQAEMLSPTGPACVPQDHLEPVLLDHLRSLSPATVLLGTEVAGVEPRPGGVRALLRPTGGGAQRTVEARYLVAADGAHSPTRAAPGIPMLGPDNLATATSVLFRAPLWELVGEHRYGLYAVTDPGAEGGIFLPAGADDRWIYGVLPELGRMREDLLDERRLARVIRAGAGAAGLEPRIERIGSFTFAAQIAPSFRRDSVFLVGDAAHRVTPRGGTGMNSAIHDGYDLGWKLAWVLRGWAAETLLDSYEAERRPVVEHNLARSADPDGTAREGTTELHADLGGRLPHLWLPSASGHISTLDLLGDGLALLTGPGGQAWARAAATLPGPLPVDVHRLDAVTARGLGISADGAMLARPDGTPAGWWATAAHAAPALGEAVASLAAGAAVGASRHFLGEIKDRVEPNLLMR